MKSRFLFAAFMLLVGCVPFKAYRQSLDRHNELVCISDSINYKFLKIRNLNEHLELEVKDTRKEIETEKENWKFREYHIRKFFANMGIKINLKEHTFWEINYIAPYTGEKMHEEFMKKNKCRDPDNARNISWLSEKEKETYYWLNFVRMYPKEFCDEYILPLHQQTTEKDNPYIISLMDYLYKMRPLNALIPDKQAYESARCHAISSGKEGHKGHIRLKACPDKMYTECLSYEKNSAKEHIIKLLLSFESNDLTYRRYLLDYMSAAGIAYAGHTETEEILVIDMLNK